MGIIFLIFDLVLWTLVISGIVVAYKKYRGPIASPHMQSQVSLGGWLIVFIVLNGLGGFFDLSNLGSIYELQTIRPRSSFTHCLIFYAIIMTIIGVFKLFTSYHLCKRTPLAALRAKYLLAVVIAIHMAFVAVCAVLLSSNLAPSSGALSDFIVVRLCKTTIALIWFFYFKNSKRVMQTFPMVSFSGPNMS